MVLHGYSQAVLSPIYKNVFPFQPNNVACPQSAKAGEQISLLYGLILHRSRDQYPNLVDGPRQPFFLRQTYLVRVIILVTRLTFMTSARTVAFHAPFKMQ